MALITTGSFKGNTTNNTSQTTLVCVPNATMDAGALGVLLLSFDNSGVGGSTKIFTQATFNDSVGNTWTRRLDSIYDPGGAGAGIEIAAYTSLLATQVTTSDNVTVTVSPATVGKTSTFYAVTADAGTPTYVTAVALSDGLTSGQTSTTPSVVTSSLPSGDAVIGWDGAETNSATTGDSDTLNGTWSATAGASTNQPIRIDSQIKLLTGTGAQTYNVTLGASVDWQIAWLQITEVVSGTSIKTVNGLAKASVKTVDDLAIASVKTIEGLA